MQLGNVSGMNTAH